MRLGGLMAASVKPMLENMAPLLARTSCTTLEKFPTSVYVRRHGEHKAKAVSCAVDEGRKRVIGIMAAILASLHMQTADDLFGGPQGSPRSDKLWLGGNHAVMGCCGLSGKRACG
jgi:hypothetical protein